MDKVKLAKQTLSEQLKFAQRAAVLVKTPQYNELQKMMMEDMAKYNNDIVKTTPLSHDEYLLTLGRLQGLRMFVNKLRNAAENKDKYAEQLQQYK